MNRGRPAVKDEDRTLPRSLSLSQREVEEIKRLTGENYLTESVRVLVKMAQKGTGVLAQVATKGSEEEKPSTIGIVDGAKLFGEWWEEGGHKFIAEKGLPKYPEDMEPFLISKGMVVQIIKIPERHYAALWAKKPEAMVSISQKSADAIISVAEEVKGGRK
jgi:hypothetical protein